MRAMTMVAVVALALGCSNESGPPYACERNADCPGHDEPWPLCADDPACVRLGGCDTLAGFCILRCQEDADCEGGQVCQAGWNLCRFACGSNADCPADWFCGVVNHTGLPEDAQNACLPRPTEE
jgi:hypothetical protein